MCRGAPGASARDDDPNATAGDEGGQQADQEYAGEVVEVPDGLGEQAEGGGMVAAGGQAGCLPDATDSPPTQADNPGGGHEREGGEDLGSEAGGEWV